MQLVRVLRKLGFMAATRGALGCCRLMRQRRAQSERIPVPVAFVVVRE